MSEIKLTLPAETLLALKGTSESAAAEVRLAAAVKLYELGRLSSGAAAALAGIPRTVFLAKLADYGVPTFKLSKEELQGDLERASPPAPTVPLEDLRRENLDDES